MKVKFISVTNKHRWAACSEKVTIEVEGTRYVVGLISNGYVSWGEEEIIETAPWSVRDVPDEIKHLKSEIENIINANVSWGCCGGCI